MSKDQNLPGRDVPPRTPGWVKVFVAILIVLVVIVVIAHLLGFRFDHGAGAAFSGSVVSLIEYTVPQ